MNPTNYKAVYDLIRKQQSFGVDPLKEKISTAHFNAKTSLQSDWNRLVKDNPGYSEAELYEFLLRKHLKAQGFEKDEIEDRIKSFMPQYRCPHTKAFHKTHVKAAGGSTDYESFYQSITATDND